MLCAGLACLYATMRPCNTQPPVYTEYSKVRVYGWDAAIISYTNKTKRSLYVCKRHLVYMLRECVVWT